MCWCWCVSLVKVYKYSCISVSFKQRRATSGCHCEGRWSLERKGNLWVTIYIDSWNQISIERPRSCANAREWTQFLSAQFEKFSENEREKATSRRGVFSDSKDILVIALPTHSTCHKERWSENVLRQGILANTYL